MNKTKIVAFICSLTIALSTLPAYSLNVFATETTATTDTSSNLNPINEVSTLSYLDVNINDGFFRDYIKQTICEILPTAIANVETSKGGMPNIINAAKKNTGLSYGAFDGALYVDSDVHKVLESMCMALSVDPMKDAEIIAAQKKIKAKLEEWIPYFVDAQEPSGYFDTYYTLKPDLVKFSDVSKHELYCMGHFIEAAIAHYECTDGKDTRLFDAAIKCADFLAVTFGNGSEQRRQIAGHQEIEIALLKLSALCDKIGGDYSPKADSYTALAAFFLEIRGDYSNRTVRNKTSEYYQDHKKVEEQTTAVGHAVRAQYMYSAMAELAAINQEYNAKYSNTLSILWNDVTKTKQYVTGGVGQTRSNEGFSTAYSLNNYTAYCETCAGIANMLWNRNMTKLYTDAQYSAVIETDLYNTVLGCVNFDGNEFFYQNTLATKKGVSRNKWYGTACCPPNLTRTLLSVGGYIYNYNDSEIYINQYISNKANIKLADTKLTVNMTSELPWESGGSIKLKLNKATEFTLFLRIPAWTNKSTVKLNGKALDLPLEDNGYVKISRKWENGDKIEFDFSMPVLFENTSEKVENNIGYISLRRGPIVYCAEAVDNDFNVTHAYVDTFSKPELLWTDSLDGKKDPYGVRDMYTIKLAGYTDGLDSGRAVEWTFVPFYARSNRDIDAMTVYVQDSPIEQELHKYATPSASYTFSSDSVFNLNDGSDSESMRWTSYKSGSVVENPWVMYEFDGEISLSGCKIWWYSDGGGVKLPESFEIYYKNNETNSFTPVTHTDKFTCVNSSGYSTYNFDTVKATAIKVVMQNSNSAVGIVEWELIGEKIEQPKTVTNIVTSLDYSTLVLIIVLGATAFIAATAIIITIIIIKKRKRAKSK